MELKKPPVVIPALDLKLDEAVELVKKLNSVEDKIAAFKIGSLQTLDFGLKKAVADLRKVTKVPIIYDHQKGCTDIPAIVEKQVKVVMECGANAFIAVPLGAGPSTLESFVDTCNDFELIPIVLLEMTHPGANDYLKENVSRTIFDKAVELGVRHFVAPGNKPEKLREYRDWIEESGQEAFIVSPGIGAQGGQCKKAVEAGTDYPIVGRAIYTAEDPCKVVEDLYEESLEGYGGRK